MDTERPIVWYAPWNLKRLCGTKVPATSPVEYGDGRTSGAALPSPPDSERDDDRKRQREPGDGVLQVIVLEMDGQRTGFWNAAFGLEEITPTAEGVVLDYLSHEGKPVRIMFTFSRDAKIQRTACAPARQASCQAAAGVPDQAD